MRILVIESDRAEADALSHRLSRQGHEVVVAGTGAAALKRFSSVQFVLLDLELSDVDGVEVCRAIRAAGDLPVIVVSERDTEIDRVLGLQAGADDYLGKPYGFRELLARMDAVLRRAWALTATSRPTPPKFVDCGPMRIDALSREVRVAGQCITVTRKEFDLLYLLASQPRSCREGS